jgi:tetratricopeptide (TPR) repeat protein
LADVLRSGKSADRILSDALEFGFFSQYTCYKGADFVDRLLDWQIELLKSEYGIELDRLPGGLEEIAPVPAPTKRRRGGREVTPDLLRNVLTWAYIRKAFGFDRMAASRRLLEIGSGYGCLARVIKAHIPGIQCWLLDIPESLEVAKIYLRHSFPSAKLVELAAAPAAGPPEIAAADFVLVPVDNASAVTGLSFDLALNVWSFGEMPNGFIARWFEVIQKRNRVARLFSLNAFLPPVTPDAIERTRQGNWLLQFDESWTIDGFEVNPAIQRCPLIRNFYTGLAIAATRIESVDVVGAEQRLASEAVRAVTLEDWVSIALEPDKGKGDLARPEREFRSVEDLLSARPAKFSAKRVLQVLDYVGRANLDGDRDGTLYKLWNHFRLTGNVRTGELLVIFLAMIAKSNLGYRCSKEELAVLGRLPDCNLHSEYQLFLPDFVKRYQFGDRRMSIQEACDEAIRLRGSARNDEARALFARVAAIAPAHADVWYQLALIFSGNGPRSLAALCASHAKLLGPGYPQYSSEANRLWELERLYKMPADASTLRGLPLASMRTALKAAGAVVSGIARRASAKRELRWHCFAYLTRYRQKDQLMELSSLFRRMEDEPMAAAFEAASSRY